MIFYKKLQTTAEDRKGGMLLLAAGSMMLLLTVCLFSIDVAYIQLVRTELRTATDAASNAGCEALAREQDQALAVTAAINVAALNTVGGQPLVIQGSNVDLGSVAVNANSGMYDFTVMANGAGLVNSVTPTQTPVPALSPIPEVGESSAKRAPFAINQRRRRRRRGGGGGGGGGGRGGGRGRSIPTLTTPTPPTNTGVSNQDMNSVRVTADRGDINTLSGGLFMSGTFKPTQQATSTNSVRDVALVVDRSGSMKQNEDSNYGYPESTWKMTHLKAAVASFVEILEDSPTEIRCSLSSYDTYASKDVNMTANLGSIESAVNNMSPGSRTNIGGGLQHATDSLAPAPVGDANSRPYSTKAIVLMTDGKHNEGTHPDSVIPDCVARGHVVYTITFGERVGDDMIAAHDLMQKIADDTGGKHFAVSTGAQLDQAFQDIAHAIAVVLVQ